MPASPALDRPQRPQLSFARRETGMAALVLLVASGGWCVGAAWALGWRALVQCWRQLPSRRR